MSICDWKPTSPLKTMKWRSVIWAVSNKLIGMPKPTSTPSIRRYGVWIIWSRFLWILNSKRFFSVSTAQWQPNWSHFRESILQYSSWHWETIHKCYCFENDRSVKNEMLSGLAHPIKSWFYVDTLDPPPPKAFKRTATNQSANSYKKAGTTLEYSLTKNSKLSYKDASTLWRLQIDIPMTLMVQDSKTNIPYRLLNPTNTSATAITSTKTTTMMKDSIILTDIQTEQRSNMMQNSPN
jgi:hypothetical protein